MKDYDHHPFFLYVAQTSDSPLVIEAESADGVYIHDIYGKKYLDMVAGISVNNLGHRHPAVLEAIRGQLERYLHLMVYGEFIQKAQTDYAEELVKYLPEKLNNVYFVNSGSEAVEGALKLARRFTGKFEVVTFRNAYHGGTAGALSVMGGEYFKQAYRPLIPGIRILDYNQTDQLDQITNKTACVIVEPIQGEAGMILPRADYLQVLRKRCDETGALLLFDEVQTGFGRVGELFAFQHYHVIPDVLILAKALGGGLPLGAFIASREIMEVLTHNPALSHLTTFGGHPLSCAAGLGALRYLMSSGLLGTVQKKGNIVKERMHHKLIREVRGNGLLLAVDLDNYDVTNRVVRQALHKGVISDWFLFRNQAFRISPPLIISEKELNEGCDILLESMDDVQQNRA